MRQGLNMLLGLIVLVSVTACGTRNPAAAPTATAPVVSAVVAHPDLSGFWNLDMSVPRDDELMKQVAPNTAFLDDTGPKEFPAGDFGGLKLKPAALEAARKWDPYAQLTPENACKAPSIIYAMQGPFPIEIFQSDKFIVMKLEYYDMVRMLFLDGRQPESDYPASKEGFSSAHWDGATLVVDRTGKAVGTVILGGGYMTVSSAGSVEGVDIESGGTLKVDKFFGFPQQIGSVHVKSGGTFIAMHWVG